MNDLDFSSANYTGRRLRCWLASMMERQDVSHEELAEALNYSRPEIVKLWLDGRSIIDWRHIPKLAEVLHIDPATLIPLFIDQQITDDTIDIREQVFEASCRICPEWEYPLHVIARNIYITGEESIWNHLPDYMG